jgi:hypothetical protein
VKFLLAFVSSTASALALFVALLLTPSIALSQTTAGPCDEQAICQAQKGALLLAQGLVEEAAVALEKALLLDPNLPGAQLDYAQALALIGLKGSARAMLADVLQRPDIQLNLKSKLVGAQNASNESTQPSLHSQWHWSNFVQASVGHESNLNSATFSDSLTLMLPNGPVTIGLADSAKPIAGPATKALLAMQGSTRLGPGIFGMGELLVSAVLSNKKALQTDSLTGIKPDRNQTAEAAAKFSLPMIAGVVSGQWQFTAGGTQYWLGSASAYTDTSFSVKFNWDQGFEPVIWGWSNLGRQSCKLAPSLGQTRQRFPLSTALDGVYSFARMEMLCKALDKESQLVLGSGSDKAQYETRPGGDKKRLDVLLRHEHLVPMPWSPWRQVKAGQVGAWFRYAKSADAQNYSELLGDLKTTSQRTDLGLSFSALINNSWTAGLKLERTSQRSNNPLFNLKNLSAYLEFTKAIK